jgi:gamma-glutamylcyclotransferase (GGCT)/AIG2-like uncharacterized protein YtfP
MGVPEANRGDVAELPLFIYGTLAEAGVYAVITGENPPRVAATLPDYEKVFPAKSFPYVAPRPGAEVTGELIVHLSAEALALLDQYEDAGRLYLLREVAVRGPAGPQRALTYVAGPELLRAGALPDVDVADRVTDFIRRRIEAAIAEGVAAAGRVRELELRARRELLGEAIAQLVRESFPQTHLTRYAIKHGLAASDLPSLAWVAAEPYAARYAPAYLRLILKAIVFNQLEDRISRDFRGAVRVTVPYYEHAVSSLAALQFAADRLGPLADMTSTLGVDRLEPALEYMDYAAAAIFIADELYGREAAAPYVERVKERRTHGGVPLGAELEFSPLGAAAIGAAPDDDPVYDGFYYFDDFDLGGRWWKLGGHVDDHHAVLEGRGRVRGFFELALGRYGARGDLSQPVTGDPVILSDLANAAVAFVAVPPHSLHLSLQLERGRPFGPPAPLEHLLCLLLGGDLARDDQGAFRERRIFDGEVRDALAGLDFSRPEAHRRRADDADAAPVVEFGFPRLYHERSYVDLIVALKGFQLATNPPPLDVTPGAPDAVRHRETADALAAWAAAPRPLGRTAIRDFLATVERGLAYETEKLAGHGPALRDRWLAAVESRLFRLNAFVAAGGDEKEPP